MVVVVLAVEEEDDDGGGNDFGTTSGMAIEVEVFGFIHNKYAINSVG